MLEKTASQLPHLMGYSLNDCPAETYCTEKLYMWGTEWKQACRDLQHGFLTGVSVAERPRKPSGRQRHRW